MSAEYCALAPSHSVHGPYHDREYGFPARDDRVLFERLVLEINQAGLSWLTILKKRASFTAAFAEWDIRRVADFGARDVERLLADPGIIRNRLKVEAAIENARRILALKENHGSFAAWLDAHHPRPKPEWVRLFRDHFRFTGGEIVGEFLMSLGYLPGAHDAGCPVHAHILRLNPPWAAAPTIRATSETKSGIQSKRPKIAKK
jgi:DNA-3-methyladenine glycosylase I